LIARLLWLVKCIGFISPEWGFWEHCFFCFRATGLPFLSAKNIEEERVNKVGVLKLLGDSGLMPSRSTQN